MSDPRPPRRAAARRFSGAELMLLPLFALVGGQYGDWWQGAAAWAPFAVLSLVLSPRAFRRLNAAVALGLIGYLVGVAQSERVLPVFQAVLWFAIPGAALGLMLDRLGKPWMMAVYVAFLVYVAGGVVEPFVNSLSPAGFDSTRLALGAGGGFVVAMFVRQGRT